jgi:hypothetical protein
MKDDSRFINFKEMNNAFSLEDNLQKNIYCWPFEDNIIIIVAEKTINMTTTEDSIITNIKLNR